MSDLRKWRVTGPDGFERIIETNHDQGEHYALAAAFYVSPCGSTKTKAEVMFQAGYRAEPIEEPKMVTVRAEDVEWMINRINESVNVGERSRRLRAALAAQEGEK